MFLRDKLCRKKILFIWSFLAVSLAFGFVTFSPSKASASAVPLSIQSFDLKARFAGQSQYEWTHNITYNQYITSSGVPPESVLAYQFNSSSVNATGNYASIHFETNLVFSQPTSLAYVADFVNRPYITLIACSSSLGQVLQVKSKTISSVVTEWTGKAPSTQAFDTKNKTLTIYGDIALSGLSQGSQHIYCMIGSDPYAFYQISGANVPNFFIEQQPTTIEFTNNEADAIAQAQVNATIAVQASLNSIDANNNLRWQADHDEQDAKEVELEEQAGDLSLSTPVTDNPFNLFVYTFNSSSCINLSSIPYLFGASPMRVCSPYPSNIRGILGVVSSLFLSAILIRLYYKHLKGGFGS